MPRLRSILSIILVLVTTLLVSCGSPEATIPTTYSAGKIEQLQVYVQPIQEFRDKMSVLEDLITSKNWVDTRTYIHGPLGQLRQSMLGLSRSLLPNDEEKARQLAKNLFVHFERIDAAAKDKDSAAAITQYQEALKDFDAFLNIVPS
jgi:photosystem II protein PsbQ